MRNKRRRQRGQRGDSGRVQGERDARGLDKGQGGGRRWRQTRKIRTKRSGQEAESPRVPLCAVGFYPSFAHSFALILSEHLRPAANQGDKTPHLGELPFQRMQTISLCNVDGQVETYPQPRPREEVWEDRGMKRLAHGQVAAAPEAGLKPG